MDESEAKLKAARYCAYQERARFEVEEKLKSYGIGDRQAKKILRELIEEGYINEGRFARAFSRGKFNNNKWGRIKIRQHLLQKQIPESLVEQGLSEIPVDEYLETIKSLIKQKGKALDEPDDFIRKNKIAVYLIQKGYEADLVWEELNRKVTG